MMNPPIPTPEVPPETTPEASRDSALVRPGAGPDRARAVARRIERDIGMGEFAPGSWLKQVDLERRYEATRMEVRQALDLLAEKGLVRHLARRGYQVEVFDQERVRQVAETRAILEAAAAELVIDRLDEASLAAMTAAAEACRACVLGGTTEEHERWNLEFHQLMLAPCPNRELVKFIFDLRTRIPISVMRRRNTVAVLLQVVEQHFDIIRLIRARDLPALQRLMREHTLGARTVLEG